MTNLRKFSFNYANIVNNFLVLGGLDTVTKERKWSQIATRMGLPSGKNLGTLLKNHYERILYPFDVFQDGKTVDDMVGSSDQVG